MCQVTSKNAVVCFSHSQFLMFVLSLQLRAEVERLEVLKMQSMKSVIEVIRAEIALFWERCFYSQEQQQSFFPYHAGE